MRSVALVVALLASLPAASLAAAEPAARAPSLAAGDLELLGHVERSEWDALKAIGPPALEGLIRLYRAGDEERRELVAGAFYLLGWRSEEAAVALLEDVHTQHQGLRLSAQYALGRVSDSPVVVEVLLENMMKDPNPLFRDKAACALAYDQIHLSEGHKVRLFEGLIEALAEPVPQVRAIAIKALKIHTGQTKGFAPTLPEPKRAEAIERWRQWLDEYRAAL
jgi:HEAT repeat protein